MKLLAYLEVLRPSQWELHFPSVHLMHSRVGASGLRLSSSLWVP